MTAEEAVRDNDLLHDLVIIAVWSSNHTSGANNRPVIRPPGAAKSGAAPVVLVQLEPINYVLQSLHTSDGLTLQKFSDVHPQSGILNLDRNKSTLS
jgi:hypothetical protein